MVATDKDFHATFSSAPMLNGTPTHQNNFGVTAGDTPTFDIVELLAMGLCAKTAIKNGGAGHGKWWELGPGAKAAFRTAAETMLKGTS